MKTSSIGLLLLGVVIGGGLQSCNKNSSNQSDMIQFHLTADPVTLDPQKAEDGAAIKILSNTEQGLFAYDGQGHLVPALSETLEPVSVSVDGTKISFRVRGDAKWSDGVPLTSEHVLLGLTRAIDPETGAKMADILKPIESVSLDPKDKSVIVFKLKKPISYLRELLALMIASPMRQDRIRDGKFVETGLGSGPYLIKSRELTQSILLEPNPHYYGTRAIKPVLARIVTDESAALNLFRTGKLDILSRISALDLPKLKSEGLVQISPYLVTYYLGFNQRKAPANEKSFREAVAHSIDKRAIVEWMGGGETVASTFVPSIIKVDHLKDQLHLRPPGPSDLARWKTQESKIEMGYDINSRNTGIVEKIQADLQKSLGLKLRLSGQEWKSYIKGLTTDAPMIYRFGWLAAFWDPLSHLMIFRSDNPNNYTGWKNARYDALVDEISILKKGPVRDKRIEEAEDILVRKDIVIVPIFHYTQSFGVSKRIKGFTANPFGMVLFSGQSF